MARSRSVTAAGRILKLDDEAVRKEIDRRPFEWQRKSLDYYDPMSGKAIGEVHFAARYKAEAMARLRVFPAIQLDPEADPVSVTSEQLTGEDRPTDEEIKLLLAATERLTNTHGGLSDILRGLELNNFLAGEGYLIGRTVEDLEEWEVHSVDALDQDSSGRTVGLKIHPNDSGDKLVLLDDATVIRIWIRHPRFPELPDAAMGAALTYCDDLRLFTQMIRATGRSRMPSHVFGVPLEASEGPTDFSTDEGDTETQDKLTEDLIKHFSTPISNPEDASAVVPFILRLAGEDLAKVQKWDFARDIDRLAVELRRESREALAATLDLPADVLSGKQGLNHWTAWSVDEETFRVHLAPDAELLMAGLTSGYLHPMIRAAIPERWRKFVLWYDPIELVAHPNRAQNAKDGHGAMVISDATYRDALGFDEDDAPDEAEIQRRIEIARSIREPAFPGSGSAPASAETTEPGPPDSSVTASAATARGSLGYQLATIEQGLMDRLLTAADAELRRALDRAGNVIVSSARRKAAGEPTRRIVADVRNPSELAARLGETHVFAMGLTTDQLLDGAFEQLRDRFLTWTGRAQRQALAAVIEAGEDMDEEEQQELLDQMEEDRNAGWAVLLASLTSVAARRLFDAGEPSALGERDPSIMVPPGALREALSVAGGGPRAGAANSTAVSGEGRGGLLSGQNIAEAFRRAALAEAGWVWLYGDPATRHVPFEPHMALDGVTFSTWTDDVLLNAATFPETEFLYPGDHDGCQCTFARDATATVSDQDGPENDGE